MLSEQQGTTGRVTEVSRSRIAVQGQSVTLPALIVGGKTIIVQGNWFKVAAVKDEDYQENTIVSSLDEFVTDFRPQLEGRADIFTFSQKPADPVPRFPFPYEWASIAAIPIISFSDWWTNRVSGDLRKDVRRAAKRGVVVRSVPFTDAFVRQIMDIYDETPIRQGRPFWHYHKGFDVVHLENATYLEQSDFLGAFCGDELIGFVKVVFAGQLACLMQIISKDAHRDKRPMNALIARTVELCATKCCKHLTYGKYRYYGIDSSLTAFKHRNGFQEILVPKYYVPLTTKGRVAVRMGLHRGARALVPVPVRQVLKRLRTSIYDRFLLTHKPL